MSFGVFGVLLVGGGVGEGLVDYLSPAAGALPRAEGALDVIGVVGWLADLPLVSMG